MRRILMVASCLVLAFSTVAKADVVADFWANVLSAKDGNGQDLNLTYNDAIRVVFVSSGVLTGDDVNRTGTPSYDSSGDTMALGGIVTGTFKGLGGSALTGSDWEPLVTTVNSASGTPVLDWIENTGLAARPVFNTRGEFLGYDHTTQKILSGIDTGIRYDESADDQSPQGSVVVWTGTNANGGPTGSIPSTSISGTVLGYTEPSAGTIEYASFGLSDSTSNWLFAGYTARQSGQILPGPIFSNEEIARSIYVMSGDVMVVPEPTSILMWLGFSGVAGLVFWRKRRKS